MSKKLLILLFILFFFGSPVTQAEEKIGNAGFTPGNIWYSKDPFFAGDVVIVHTMVFNSGLDEISGTVEFYDAVTLLGKIPFNISPGGGFKNVTMEWKVNEGYHKIFALIQAPKVMRNGVANTITLDYYKTNESERFVKAREAKAESATTTVENYFDEKINFAKEYADKNLPAPISQTVNAVGAALENVRVASKTWVDKKGADVNKNIVKLKEAETKESALKEKDGGITVASLEKPFNYMYALALSAASSVFDSKLFFYGGLLVLIFFVIRFIKRKLFF
ncbi:MAG: hypothetical protein AAB756_00445 [Patescibacteria group bacterium]